jgi:archaetidylinositol phosphate synthase
MPDSHPFSLAVPTEAPAVPRAWDARLARWLVMPLRYSRVTPNHLTTVRLAVGLGAAWAFTYGTYDWSNIAALLLVLSNFLDHTDGELARISGKSSRVGHLYDLASDAAITVLLFIAMGVGLGGGAKPWTAFGAPPAVLGAVAGCSVAVIFLLRMRIEDMAGKAASRQGSWGGFETEDVLYLLPIVTLLNTVKPFLLAAAIGAPLFAIWVVIDYRRVLLRSSSTQTPSQGTA